MKNIVTYLVVFSLLWTACQKGGSAQVEGYIYKTGTTIPIQNARIDLIETHNANQGEWSRRMYSDETGHYKISYFIRFNKSYRYYVMVTIPSTYDNQTKQMTHSKEKFDFYFP